MTRRLLVLLLPLLTLLARPGSGAAAETPFPRPPALVPRVEFWKKVFTLYDTHQVVVHDRDDLSLVYGVENVGRGGRSEQQQRETEVMGRYRAALLHLAALGPQVEAAQLNDAEWRIWEAHGRRRDPERYRQAAERLRLQTGQRDRIAQGLRNWERYGQDVRRILHDQGVPDSLAVLAFIESAFNPEATSKVGAAGLWQITRPAAAHLLRMDRHVDERRDPLKATAAAAAILKANYQALGNWPLAITAYNHGAYGLARGVREVGSTDVAVLVERYRGKAFGFAGQNFYAEFLAALEVIPRAELYFAAAPPLAAADSSGAPGALRAPAAAPIAGVAQLLPPAPNPFRRATTLAYGLAQTRLVQLDIIDAAGQRIRSLVQQVQGPGHFLVAWDGTSDTGRPVVSGVYFARLQAGTWSTFGRLMLLR